MSTTSPDQVTTPARLRWLDAITHTPARAQLGHLADRQAALRRLVTLVARSVTPAEVFSAVVSEVRDLLGADITGIFHFQPNGTAIFLAGVGTTSRPGRRVQLEPGLAIEAVFRTGRCTRVDDYGHAGRKAVARIVCDEAVRCSVASPIIVGWRAAPRPTFARPPSRPELPTRLHRRGSQSKYPDDPRHRNAKALHRRCTDWAIYRGLRP